MRILTIGDFHGKFSGSFVRKIIKDENIDLIVSVGDFLPFHYRDLWFKHCYGKDIGLWEIIGKKKYKELVLKDLEYGEEILKKLDGLGVPVFTVLGNMDWPAVDDVVDEKGSMRKIYMPNYDRRDAFAKRIKKYENIHRFDYEALRFDGYVFIGMRGHTVPGEVNSRAFRRHEKKLDRLFSKYEIKNKDGRVIFVSHNVAHNTKLDIISMEAVKKIEKNSGKKFSKRELERKRHYGSKMAKRIIKRYHPVLHVGGHVHEGRGEDKIGKTVCINPGEFGKKECAVVDVEMGKVKSVKLLK